jgi:hypothetical protein
MTIIYIFVHSNERPIILFPPFFLAPGITYHQVFALAQQAKANADRAESESARPGEG